MVDFEARLGRLERRMSRAYWSDGLLDLFCGLALLGLGAAWLAEQFVWGPLVPAVLIPLWGPLRRRLTEPRLGAVELGEPRQARNRSFVLVSLFAGLAALLLVGGALLAHRRGLALPRLGVEALPGLIVGLAGVVTAELLELRRFFIHAGAALLAAVVVALVPGLNPGWAFLAAGASALIVGLVLRVRFVRRYPGEAEGEAGEEPGA